MSLREVINAALDKPPITTPSPGKPKQKGQTVKNKFKCRRCGKRFFLAHELATHARVDHKEEREREQAQAAQATEEAASEARKSGEKLTTRMMIDKHPAIIEQMAKEGSGVVLRAHPEFRELLLGRGEDAQRLYNAVNMWRQGVRPTGQPLAAAGAPVKTFPERQDLGGGRFYWKPDQIALVKSIINDPQWKRGRNGTLVNWKGIFTSRPDWAKVLRHGEMKHSTFLAFVQRVRTGKTAGQRIQHAHLPVPYQTTIAAVPVNGNGSVMIADRAYTYEELEAIIKEKQNALRPLKHCPECGYSLLMHSKAYTIAIRHSNTEE